MAQASFIFALFSAKEKEIVTKVATKFYEEQVKFNNITVGTVFRDWVRYTAHLRKIAHDEEQKLQAINVLKNSTRGQRSTMEKEILRRFVLNNLSCIPKSISFTEMDTLCNELDWYPLIGRSIIFLQGDFGNVYYMIASGTIGLYLEPSKDREMVIAREFGNLRAQSFPGSDEDLKALGNNILNLPVRNMKLSLPYCFQIGIAKYYIERRRIWRVCDLSDYK
jgi:hypothetical protein